MNRAIYFKQMGKIVLANERHGQIGYTGEPEIIPAAFNFLSDATRSANFWAGKGLLTSVLGDGPWYVGLHNVISGAVL